MFTWPKLVLTDYERLWVRPYKTAVQTAKGKKILPGVLRRTYERTISNDAEIAGREGLAPGAQLQISRRARVFGISFTGSVSATRLQITNASGTLYTVRDARTAKDPYVSALTGGTPYMAGTIANPANIGPKRNPNGGLAADVGVILTGEQSLPLLLDPNWVLTPNETLIFNGDWSDAEEIQGGTYVLNICVHVWEFPEMGNADKAIREVI